MADPDKKKGPHMTTYGLILPALILMTLMVIAYVKRGPSGIGAGFTETWTLLLRVVPNLVIGFTLAGFLTLLLPQEIVARWIGADSGAGGIAIGTIAGALTPGGPFTHFPILASLMARGAAIGPLCAYIAAWALLGIHRIIIWELPLMGWRFVAIRVTSCLVLAPLSGVLANSLVAISQRP